MDSAETYSKLEEWCDHLRATLSPEERIRAVEERYEQETEPAHQEILSSFLAREYVAQGRQDLARELRSKDPAFQVYQWYKALRKDGRDADLIPFILERLRSEAHPRKIRTLRDFLATEYVRRDDYASAAALHEEDAKENPADPLPLMALASLKQWEHPAEALRLVNEAVDVAMRAGVFRRQALGNKCRIAAMLKDYRTVEDVIRQLLALTFTRGSVDCGVERDFLDRLPPNSINPDLARQYDDYCRVRGRLPGPPDGPDEPPKWEPPEWDMAV